MMMKSVRWGLTVLFLLPLFVLAFKVTEINFEQSSVWLPVFGKTLLQAGLSALFSVGLGIVGALGLLGMSQSRWLGFVSWMALLPGFFPPLIVLSSLFVWSDQLGFELKGLGAVVFVHVVINSGICSVAIYDLIVGKLGELSSVARLMGANSLQFYRRVMIPVLAPDFVYIFMMVFALCVTSFSIPLIVGDASMSLEVLIYQKMKISKDWNQAFVMTSVQILLIFILFYPLQKSGVHKDSIRIPTPFYGWTLGIFLIFAVVALSGLGVFWGVPKGISIWQSVATDFNTEFLQSFLGTCRITFLTALFTFLLLNLVALDFNSNWLHRLLTGYLAPSPVIVGFSLWSLTPNTFWWSEIKIALSLSLIFLPALYRWKAASALLALKKQVLAARTMGANQWQIFKDVIFPQSVQVICWLTGVAAFWASGDFVLSTLLGFGHHTLGILAEGLLASYQFELASVVTLIIFIFGWMCFYLLGVMGRVLNKKPLS